MDKFKYAKVFKLLLSYMLIVFGAFFLAISTYMFTVPAKFIPGGVTGVASMVETLFGFSASYTIALINVPLLVLAGIFLNKKFALRTMFGILFLTGFLELFKAVNMYKFYNVQQPIISALFAGCLSGIGIGMLINATASPGGTEVISMLVQKKLKNFKFSYILMTLNIIIITIGAMMYFFVGKMSIEDILIILGCSILQVLINSKSLDMIVNGINSAVKFEIITDKGKELSSALVRDLGYGVTIINSRGAYSDEKSTLLVCVVPKVKISAFKEVIHNNDPNAFVFSINTREVMGKKFKKTL